MYVDLDGNKLSTEDIRKYNSNKKAVQIFPNLGYRVTSVEQFLVDERIKKFHDFLKNSNCEVRSRVSKDGNSLLYCLVGDCSWFKIPISFHPYKIIDAIDFKYFKEVDEENLPGTLESLIFDSDDENEWQNRYIRCKLIHNLDQDIIDEFVKFCEEVGGVNVELKLPYLKATFKNQQAKENIFEQMAVRYKPEGSNIGYFRRHLKWENISISEYERCTEK